MKTEILVRLYESNLFTRELTKALGVEQGQVLRWLVELGGEGLVKRRQSGAWGLSDGERVRRRNRLKYAARREVALAANVKRDTSPFPRPPYQTPEIGFYGPVTTESGQCVTLTCSVA